MPCLPSAVSDHVPPTGDHDPGRSVSTVDSPVPQDDSRAAKLSETRSTLPPSAKDVGNPFPSTLHRSIEDVARRRGTLVLAGSGDENPEREQELLRAFPLSRRVDGLIVMSTGYDHRRLREHRRGTPVVFVDRPGAAGAGDSVTVDNRAWSARTSAASTPRRRSRPTCSTDPTPRPPFFAAQNLLTIGVVRTLLQRRLSHRVALVGFDEVLLADLLDPGITVVAQDVAAIGRAAAGLPFARVDGEPGPPRHVIVPTTLLVRGSGEIGGQ